MFEYESGIFIETSFCNMILGHKKSFLIYTYRKVNKQRYIGQWFFIKEIFM